MKLIDFVRSSKKLKSITLVLILALGFIFRFLGIFWGLPLFNPYEKNYHPDEPKIIEGAENFPEHISINTDFRYPTLCHYLLGILALPLKEYLKIFNVSSYEYVHLLGRLISVIVGTSTIFLTYLYAQKIYDVDRAVLASFFLAFSMYHVQDSAWATTDVMTSFLATVFFLLLWNLKNEDRLKNYFYLGIVYGLAIGSKYTTALLIIPALIVYSFSIIKDDSSKEFMACILKKCFNIKVMIFIVTSIIVFLITTPGIFLYFDKFISSIEYEKARLSRFDLPYTSTTYWKTIWIDFSSALGYPLAMLFFFGLIFPLRKKNEWIAMLSVIVGLIFYFGNSLVPRYLIFVMPFIAIISSHCIISLFEIPNKFLKAVTTTFLVFIGLYSILNSTAAVYSRFDDSRTRAAKFIAENVPIGSTIGIPITSLKFGKLPHEWRYPKIVFDKFDFISFLEKPEYLVISSYDYNEMQKALKSNKLKPGYIWDANYNKEWYQSTPPSQEIFKFFDDFINKNKKEYTLIASFKKNQLMTISFPAPEILIYRKVEYKN
jgi:hypothetical protein